MDDGRAEEDLGVALRLLGESVNSLQGHLLRLPTASEVRLDLKQATYGGFDPKALGFKRFRDFLLEAQRRGYVVLDSTRAGDIAVGGPGDETGPNVTPTIRRDLWKAVTDWRPDLDHFFDLESDRVVSIPKEERPLEPERIRDLRSRVPMESDRYLKIPSLPWARQSTIMREFASSPGLKPDLRKLLIAALDQDKPSRSWQAVLRIDSAAYAAWQRFLKTRVDDHLSSWRRDSPPAARITMERRIRPETDAGSRSAKQETPSTDLSVLLRVAASANRDDESREVHRVSRLTVAERHDSMGERQLRLMAHRAIDQMSVEELRRLEIPLGYVFPE